MRLCIVCSTPFTGPGSRCAAHRLPHRSGSYTRNAKRVVASAVRCSLCGQPFTDPNDPPVADHVTPRSLGGSDEPYNLRASHRSCNGRAGNRVKAELSWRERQP